MAGEVAVVQRTKWSGQRSRFLTVPGFALVLADPTLPVGDCRWRGQQAHRHQDYQLPIEHWHQWIGDQMVADAMLETPIQNHHLSGASEPTR